METRERILTYLQENQFATIPLLSQLWGLTRPNIRHHIQHLIKEGLVQLDDQTEKSSSHRGRPVLTYRLSQKSADHNYQNLCSALLQLCFPKNDGPADPTLLRQLAQLLSANPIPGTTTIQKLNNLVSELTRQGYHARWEAAANGPRILFFHCPYATLLAEFPEFCLIDRLILESFTQREVNHREKMDFFLMGRRACIFELS